MRPHYTVLTFNYGLIIAYFHIGHYCILLMFSAMILLRKANLSTGGEYLYSYVSKQMLKNMKAELKGHFAMTFKINGKKTLLPCASCLKRTRPEACISCQGEVSPLYTLGLCLWIFILPQRG
jgi:hypothetical protein